MELHNLLIIFSLAWGCINADCTFDKNVDFSQYPSLLMSQSPWQSYVPVLEGSVRTVRISTGATVIVACPGTTIIGLGTEVAEATCNSGSVLNVGGSDYTMSQLGCVARVQESINRDLGSCGSGNIGDLHGIGFDVTGYGFYQLMEICFEPIEQTTLYSSDLVRGSSVPAKDTNPDRPSFKSSTGFFTVSVGTCYEQNSQIALMDQILGDSSVIDVSNSLYFARGHMAPDADFVTEMEADATYYYINAAPQWQTINNGNWKALEDSSRDLAGAHGTDFTIWSGGWEVLQLDDINSNPVDIYLGLYEGQSVIPAPDVVWKVVYEESSNRAIGIVMSNNPYLTQFPAPLCTDICSSISWVDWATQDLVKGATYCCTVSDLRNAIPHVPDLGSVGILDS